MTSHPPQAVELAAATAARTIALQMFEERGRGAVLVGVARVDAALELLLITILVAFLEAAVQQLRPFQPPVVMRFSGIVS
jgi:hypothetical protein